MEKEFDWENYTLTLGEEIQVSFRNEYNRKNVNTTERKCICKVIYVDREEGLIAIQACENIFKDRTHSNAVNHRWSASFNIGPYHYLIEDVGIASIDDLEDCENLNVNNYTDYNDLVESTFKCGYRYWLMDNSDNNTGYYVDEFGNIDHSATNMTKMAAQPFFVFDPEIYEEYIPSLKDANIIVPELTMDRVRSFIIDNAKFAQENNLSKDGILIGNIYRFSLNSITKLKSIPGCNEYEQYLIRYENDYDVDGEYTPTADKILITLKQLEELTTKNLLMSEENLARTLTRILIYGSDPDANVRML